VEVFFPSLGYYNLSSLYNLFVERVLMTRRAKPHAPRRAARAPCSLRLFFHLSGKFSFPVPSMFLFLGRLSGYSPIQFFYKVRVGRPSPALIIASCHFATTVVFGRLFSLAPIRFFGLRGPTLYFFSKRLPHRSRRFFPFFLWLLPFSFCHALSNRSETIRSNHNSLSSTP